MLFEIPLIFLRVETLGLRQTLNIWESVFHNSVLMLHLHTHKLKYHEMPCSFETERLQCKSIIFMSNPFRDRFTEQKTLNKKEMKIFITCLLFLISQMAAIGFYISSMHWMLCSASMFIHLLVYLDMMWLTCHLKMRENLEKQWKKIRRIGHLGLAQIR